MKTLMSVQIREGQIRKSASFLGKILGKLDYGDRVSVLQNNGDWIKVLDSNSGISGWLHSSALTQKKIILKAGKEDVKISATSDEYTLAGKGFNQQVETEYKKGNPQLDFSWVDKMEGFKVSSSQMQQFLAAGNIVPPGGEG